MDDLIKKVDGSASDVRTTSFKIDQLGSMMGDLTSSVKTLSSQFNDVGVLGVKDTKRIDEIESRVNDLEAGVH